MQSKNWLRNLRVLPICTLIILLGVLTFKADAQNPPSCFGHGKPAICTWANNCPYTHKSVPWKYGCAKNNVNGRNQLCCVTKPAKEKTPTSCYSHGKPAFCSWANKCPYSHTSVPWTYGCAKNVNGRDQLCCVSKMTPGQAPTSCYSHGKPAFCSWANKCPYSHKSVTWTYGCAKNYVNGKDQLCCIQK